MKPRFPGPALLVITHWPPCPSSGNWNYEVTLDFACDCTINITSTNASDTQTTVKNQIAPGPGINYVLVTTVTGIDPPGQWTMTRGPPMAAMQPQVAKVQATNATYLADNEIYINMVLAAHAQTAVWVERAKAVAAKCGCSW